MTSPIKMVVNTSPLSLPQNMPARRAPRPLNQRQPGYEKMFDYRTLFYDAMQTDDGVALIGPPLRNLAEMISGGEFASDRGHDLTSSINQLDRTSIVRLLSASRSARLVTLSTKDFQRTISLSASHTNLFADRRVLVTKSKNNKLEWISDWVKFHAAEQGIDAVLLYDNGSTEYSPEDVLEAIAQPGIDVAVVVHWPFKFGPQGGNWNGLKGAPWDSDYCEYGIMEHARHRFLSHASGVLNADIDELVMTEGNRTVFDEVNDSRSGAVTYVGRWIETVGAEGPGNSFSAYSYYDERRAPTTAKWAVDPGRVRLARQWKTHTIVGVEMDTAEKTMHRHFMGISSDWKWQRNVAKAMSSHHCMDDDLRDALSRSLT